MRGVGSSSMKFPTFGRAGANCGPTTCGLAMRILRRSDERQRGLVVSDPHEYDRAIRAADVAGLRYAGGGRFHADLTRVDLGRVWMQRFRESAPRLMRVATHPSRSIILFRTRDGDGALRQRGYDVDDETIIFFGAAAVDDQTSDGPVGFGSISLSRKISRGLAVSLRSATSPPRARQPRYGPRRPRSPTFIACTPKRRIWRERTPAGSRIRASRKRSKIPSSPRWSGASRTPNRCQSRAPENGAPR